MHRIDTTDVETDKHGSGKDGFTEGSPTVPTPATTVSADWLDTQQEEVANFLEGYDETLTKSDNNQLLKLIRKIALGICATNWFSDEIASGQSFQGVAVATNLGALRIVAVGLSGLIYYRDDLADAGTVWAAATAGGAYSGHFAAIDYDGTRFCAVGDSGEIQTDTSGTGTWTSETPAASFSDDFHYVKFANSLWIAIGENGEIQTSSDASTWTQRTNPDVGNNDLHGLDYSSDQSLWCAVGAGGTILTSPDGTTWTERTPDDSYTGIFYGVSFNSNLGLWCAVGDGEIQTSPDGTTWTTRTLTSNFDTAYRVKSLVHGFVACGFDTGSDGIFYFSHDGINWSEIHPPLHKGATGVTGLYEWVGGLLAVEADHLYWSLRSGF